MCVCVCVSVSRCLGVCVCVCVYTVHTVEYNSSIVYECSYQEHVLPLLTGLEVRIHSVYMHAVNVGFRGGNSA